MPTIVRDNYTVNAEQLVSVAETAFYIDARKAIDFLNAGRIQAQDYASQSVAGIEAHSLPNGKITNVGAIDVMGDVASGVFVDVGAFAASVVNNGSITIDGDQQGYGVRFGNAQGNLTNAGDIVVTGTMATAVRFDQAGALTNTGDISADGADAAVAVSFVLAGGTLLNTGSIVSDASDSRSSGVSGAARIVNYGVIEADVAIGGGAQDNVVQNEDGGVITGDIFLGDGQDRLTNTGAITGVVSMGSGDDVVDLRGGVFEGTVRLDEGDDTIWLSDGGDTVDGGAGVDTLHGGLGADTYYVDNAGDQVTEDRINGGVDTVFSSVSFRLGAYVENLTLTGSAGTARGNDLDNILIGNARDNFMRGGAGADTMSGSTSDDRYYVDDAGDQVIELSSEGRDWVYSEISWTLGANIEALTLTGDAWINATGNSKGNAIYGNAGRNVITGGRGADVMT
ncbi:calcium-binding protein, partial [Brevundimonas sp. Leaf363]|uniref:calcium-binding protein n=1 Tax=Brevundimonas sp. Leaf363 TaxID=1736353 RepID=UPI00350F4D3C